MTMSSVKGANNVPIALSETGEGDPVVFLHGAGADRHRWQAVSEPLASCFRTISYDRRGRADSGDDDCYSLMDEVDDLVCVMRACGNGKPVHVVAHSYGAMIALAAAMKEPGVFSRLVLYEAPINFQGSGQFVDMEHVTELDNVMNSQGGSAATSYFLEHFPRFSREEIDQMKLDPSWPGRCKAAGTLARELRATHDFTVTKADLETMAIPTLLLLGGDSIPAFQSSAATLHEHLPDSELEVLQGDTHRAMDTSPERVKELVEQFLSRAE